MTKEQNIQTTNNQNNQDMQQVQGKLTYKKYGLDYPAADKIWSRTSTVARSMASTLMPRIGYNDQTTNQKCVYCGDVANHLDHLFPLVENKRPSGFCTEPNNLVPCCGKCNQSKGAKPWDEYMNINNYIMISNLKKFLLDIEKYEGLKSAIESLGITIQYNDNLKNALKALSSKKLITIIQEKLKKSKVNSFDERELTNILNALADGKLAQIKDHLENDSLGLKVFEPDELKKRLEQLRSAYLVCIKSKKTIIKKWRDTKPEIDDKISTKFLNDSQENILYRLLKNGGEEGLNSRKGQLSNYIENNSPQKLNFNSIKGWTDWWDGLYNMIKDTLGSAQIQIDAFNEGIRTCARNKGIDEQCKTDLENLFHEYFKNLLDAEKNKKKGDGDEDLPKLHALGFSIGLDNRILINQKSIEELIQNEPKENDDIKEKIKIYTNAKKAFIMGYNYCNGLGTEEMDSIRKLYPIEINTGS